MRSTAAFHRGGFSPVLSERSAPHPTGPSSAAGRTAPNAALALLEQARLVLDEARAADESGERFRLAHLAALRTAAAIVADRGRPAATRRRLVSVWLLLDRLAPEHADWAAYFAAGASTRAAIEAGAQSAVSDRQADDQARAAGEFLAVAEQSLGLLAA